MDQESKSLDALSQFVDDYHLRDAYGNCSFESLVHMDLDSTVKMHETTVRISMGGYEAGTVTLQDVDPNDYPAVFLAKYQKMEFSKEGNLIIEGVHPRHGKYTVTVSPK